MLRRWWQSDTTAPDAAASGPKGIRAWWFWGILALALLSRVLWLEVSRNFIGADAVRYLWISQHVNRGDWLLLPQLYTSPLLPALTGLLARLTQDELLAGRLISILSNTLAVGLAMLWVRRLFPARPELAALTALGLAVNHVWCRLAPFVLTDNLFYLWLMALLLLMTQLLEEVTWRRSLTFGLVWSLLFFSREIGLYGGAIIFMVLLAAWTKRWRQETDSGQASGRLAVGSLTVLALLLTLWAAYYYQSLGVLSIGEGRRFYTSYTQTFDRERRHPHYKNGTLSFFHLRPYEMMEFTRFPAPSDPRYPPSGAARIWQHPRITFQIFWDNLLWSSKELQRVTLVGWLTLFLLVPVGLLSRRLSLPAGVYWTFGASLGVLGLHFLGPVREARLIAWFFPWLYLALAGLTLWLWRLVRARDWSPQYRNLLTVLIAGLFCWHLLFPQYFREIPRRWSLRQAPQVHAWAAAQIEANFGPGARIASREPEVVWRSQGYWLGLPYGTPEELVTWLYLGGADFLLLHDVVPIPAEEVVFWQEPQELARHFPELEVVAEFSVPMPAAYGRHGRLLRFRPQPEKMAALRQQFPWAGTHPRLTGAWAPERQRSTPAD
ncbi:MAG: glycosyltransferase family 39 protein [Desulfobacca sp.]|uniref:glycosyltransferase family 39 protein n=1 Tax=Desulfobacca sp. TaxID=2067990 RepID=UPI00404A93C7